MYEKYLSSYRDTPLKMLEIGLGCDMNYGPGKMSEVHETYTVCTEHEFLVLCLTFACVEISHNIN